MICLLVLALPAQGAAAVTMAFCHGHHPATVGAAPAHHEARAGLAQSSTHSSGPHGHDHAAAMHGHTMQGGIAADTVSGASSVDAKTTGLTSTGPHKCSACAVCCAATATSSTVIKVPAAGFAPTVFSAIVATVERFAVGGPDRPPRRPLVLPA